MDKITIINGNETDDTVVRQGRPIQFDLTELIDDNIWAVQWDGSVGIVEMKDGNDYTVENLNDFSGVLAEYNRLAHIEDNPTDYMEVDELKAIAVATVNEKAGGYIVSGFESLALGLPHKYRSGKTDQTNLLGAAMLGGVNLYKCETPEGVVALISHSEAQLAEVLSDFTDHKNGYLIRAQELKTMIAAATTVNELNLIVISLN
jgi:hypothetical protein